jgi:hypothetical protein
MRYTLRHAIAAVAALSLLLLCGRVGFAGSTTGPATIHVAVDAGELPLDTLKDGVKVFTDRGYLLGQTPEEIVGFAFTRGPIRGPAKFITLDCPAGSTAYLLFDVGKDTKLKDSIRHKFDRTLTDSDWLQIKEDEPTASELNHFFVYKRNFGQSQHVVLSGFGHNAVIVAAKDLVVDAWAPSGEAPADASTDGPKLHPHPSPGAESKGGSAAHPSIMQTSIKSLEIYETDSGMMLGQTSDVVLTLTPATRAKSPEVDFATHVGEQMNLSRDDVLRFIRLSYPQWYVEKAEITFEDRNVEHDGGSIGAAIGTMLLSCIQGFQIDQDAAITGDISANGKVRAIGGVSAKIKGAIASKCTLVAIPMENIDQLTDAVIYSGPQTITNIQVIGISTLDDATATVREDRDSQLTQAIALFADVAKELNSQPGDLKGKAVQEKLQKVLDLAPNHLSAQLLLSISQGKQRKTLSAAASQYYAFLAAKNMLSILSQRSDAGAARAIPSTAVRMGLIDLRKLRPMADPSKRALIDDWVQFIEALSDFQDGSGSGQRLEEKRQALLDEMAKENADADLMQKQLKEGV